MSKSIGEKIRQLRVLRGLSQDNLADEIPMSPGNFGKIERGEIDVNTSVLTKIAKILKVSPAEFFEDKLSSAKESSKDYGFASQHDVNELKQIVKDLAKEVSKLREEILPNLPAGKAGKKAVAKTYSRAKKK